MTISKTNLAIGVVAIVLLTVIFPPFAGLIWNGLMGLKWVVWHALLIAGYALFAAIFSGPLMWGMLIVIDDDFRDWRKRRKQGHDPSKTSP